MKIKIKNPKFIRNIIIGVIALFIVAFIINTAPGFKRNKYKDVINLVIGDENVTEKLQKKIIKDEENNIYISQEDLKNFFDKTLYYDEENQMIIATSEVCAAGMRLNEKVININGSIVDTLYTIIKQDDTIYIPIEEMKIVYNIEVNYIKDKNIVIVDKLNDGMIKAEAEKNTTIKFKPRQLSKKIETLNAGQTVSAFYTTSKGWRLIRTKDGTIGYVKANALSNEYILRQDMMQKVETQKINTNTDDNTILQTENETIVFKDLLKITSEGVLIKNTDLMVNNSIWANLEIADADLSNFEGRLQIIKNIVSIAIKNKLSGINVIMNDSNDLNTRFIIELTPRLHELGMKMNVIMNDNVNQNQFENIVDYIINK